jgi:glutamate/tyrosine decarboxylase-like PLP-dependent enzyme
LREKASLSTVCGSRVIRQHDEGDPVENHPASIWGDETPVVASVLAWAAQRVVTASDPKWTARPASELAAETGLTVTPEGIGAQEALRIFRDVLAPATRAQDDPLNLAYIPAAPTRAAVSFDLATSAANVFAGYWESGAGAIHAENQALAWICSLLGWPRTAGGVFVSGGTTGNLSALVAARHGAEQKHGHPAGRWKLACTADAHSSIRAAARVMDVEVVEVPGDELGRLTGPALDAVLSQTPDVFGVVCSAGTTNSGVVDDLVGVADACEKHGVWMHVDGAYGGAGLCAPSVRQLFDGIERADSFIVDPHKWLFAPYDACALVYREPEKGIDAHAQRASYLDQVDRAEWNPSDLAVHLSRRARGLPFWFSLATHGTDRYAAAVERSIATARVVAEAITDSDHLELCFEPQLSVVLFERPGWTDEQYTAWSTRLAKDGVILVLPTRWQGRTVLRLAFVNPMTHADDVIAALDTLR